MYMNKHAQATFKVGYSVAKTMASGSVSRSSSSLDIISDYTIGMENGYSDMKAIDKMLLPTIKNDIVQEEPESKNLLLNSQQKTVMKEFPPPISLLARTENLSSHMPWVLKRYYTRDGRLVLYEEKVRHHEYFKAHRENGRLTLQLVPMDDEYCISDEYPPDLDEGYEVDNRGEQVEDVAQEEDHDNKENKLEVAKEQEGEDVNLLEESMGKLACSISDSSEESGGGKCLKYNSSTGSLFGLPVPAIRPVHS